MNTCRSEGKYILTSWVHKVRPFLLLVVSTANQVIHAIDTNPLSWIRLWYSGESRFKSQRCKEAPWGLRAFALGEDQTTDMMIPKVSSIRVEKTPRRVQYHWLFPDLNH